ncbi:putative bifunctional diguanylate cyclase/phosphodiesterase [Oceanibaculum pacificum]|uniref:EAL domain-containing protein n=1 Tax=Oceanibaculum pacificum TaxID=580166 RepID=A0A154VA73_9PROT|nr:phosphodiesterase [Oceanibaculum pacificum]KZC98280.1 hypothetical protein AUP43_14830 [Oceanibaculum pacificum]
MRVSDAGMHRLPGTIAPSPPALWLLGLQNAQMVSAFIIAMLLLTAAGGVYLSGGTKTAMPHLFYLPVIVASFLMGLRGGLITGVLAGLACGPFMPLDTLLGTPQTSINWLTRMGYFVLAGGLAGSFSTVLTKQLQDLRHAAFRNPVTGLPNRAAFEEQMERALRIADARNQQVTLIKVRVTQMEPILSTFGYDQADTLLHMLAERLHAVMPFNAKLYYLGPGHFAVILPSSGNPGGKGDSEKEKAISVVMNMLDEVRQPVLLEDIPVAVSGHSGIACYPAHGDDVLTLTRAASQATDRAVDRDHDFAFFDPASENDYRDRVLLLSDLREAPRRNELELHYQPLLDLQSGRCVGAEALIRWQHPTRGMVPPTDFIPLAETTGLIGPLSRWVARQGLEHLAGWHKAGLDVHLSINMSARDLENTSLLEEIDLLLRQHGLSPQALTLEVTESAVIDSQRSCFALLRRLIARGYGVAIDDFGVGQSSLAYLRDLPATILKLDRGFCTALADDPRQQRIVRATVDMAHEFGMQVIAEGIENENVYSQLQALGCDQGQGYLMCRPLPEANFRDWLANRA